MKTKLAKKYTNIFLISVLVAATAACQSRAEKFFKQAQKKIEARQFLDAVDLLENSAELEKNNHKWSSTNFEIARILRFEIQDYSKSLLVYKELILKSEDVNIRLLSQEAIAEIYFENMQDYPSALKEYLLLESLLQDKIKLEKTKLKIAQCYKYMGNLNTSLEYIDVALKNSEKKVNFLNIKAQIFLTQKKYDLSLATYQQIYKEDPEYFKTENLYNSIVIVYEEKADYKSALAYLNDNKQYFKDQNYVDLKIKRMNEKLINKPFSKGIRK